ncbi:nuclear transport factor 2 family protein [Aquabacterium sp.]|uniref:nuclear transport factor 2 family protein n=1 Tax=Aquabacterium sp. TaxID=1872578 RepID=UPI002CE6C0D1|nr:nuclear transport factor 2 family protein [Aquabacterium sp.]HSW06547.1 nuclear transport factor 2 family protein [Aquabacterium sp.]
MSAPADLLQRIGQLEQRLATLEDIEAIRRLQYTYGYYIDLRLWDEMAALFVDQGASIEIGQRGRYEGREAIRSFLLEVLGQGRAGLNRNEFINHMQLQGVISVDPDGLHAQGRFRALIQGSPPQGGSTLLLAEGVYENTYVKQGGQWRIARLWWVPTFYVRLPGYDSVAFDSGPASAALPPQAASAPVCEALGRRFPPFHYRHPATGAEVRDVSSAQHPMNQG